MGKIRSIVMALAAALLVGALIAPHARAADTDFITGGGFLGPSPTLLSWMSLGTIDPPETHFSARVECVDDARKPDKTKVWDDVNTAELIEITSRECIDGDGDGDDDSISYEGLFICNGIPGAEGLVGLSDGTDVFAGREVEPPFVAERRASSNGSDDSAEFFISGCSNNSGNLDGGNIQFHEGKG